MKKLLKQLIYNCFSLGLDRKISVRATRDELIERGILLPDVASVGNSNSVSANMQLHNSRLPQHSNNFSNIENTVKGRKDIYKSKSIIYLAPFILFVRRSINQEEYIEILMPLHLGNKINT